MSKYFFQSCYFEEQPYKMNEDDIETEWFDTKQELMNYVDIILKPYMEVGAEVCTLVYPFPQPKNQKLIHIFFNSLYTGGLTVSYGRE